MSLYFHVSVLTPLLREAAAKHLHRRKLPPTPAWHLALSWTLGPNYATQIRPQECVTHYYSLLLIATVQMCNISAVKDLQHLERSSIFSSRSVIRFVINVGAWHDMGGPRMNLVCLSTPHKNDISSFKLHSSWMSSYIPHHTPSNSKYLYIPVSYNYCQHAFAL